MNVIEKFGRNSAKVEFEVIKMSEVEPTIVCDKCAYYSTDPSEFLQTKELYIYCINCYYSQEGE